MNYKYKIIYFYLFVVLTYSVDMEELLDAASSRLPTLRGLKYTDFNLSMFSACVTSHGGKYQILYGSDEVR